MKTKLFFFFITTLFPGDHSRLPPKQVVWQVVENPTLEQVRAARQGPRINLNDGNAATRFVPVGIEQVIPVQVLPAGE